MKIGVFVCHCGLNIARNVDIDEVVSYAQELDNVDYVKDIKFACTESGQEEIAEAIEEHQLDAFVVAACSPKMHEATFRSVAIQAGLNPYVVAMANIREQCSWVHQDRDYATIKAKDLVRMAVARARASEPLQRRRASVKKAVAIIGGGVAGIEAATIMAKSGIKVYLIEKKPTIGGHMALLNEVFPTNDCSICILAPKMSEVWKNPNIEVITNAELKEVSGRVGNFSVKLTKYPRYVDTEKCVGCIDDCSSVCPIEVPNEYDQSMGVRKAIYLPIPQSTPFYAVVDWENCIGCRLCEKACAPDAIDFDQKKEDMELKVGAVIVATGYKPFNPNRKPEYGYSSYKNVITTLELERLLSASGPTLGNLNLNNSSKVAFIQCVGSRDEKTHEYCSRVCCMESLKNALIIKDRYPDSEVSIIYTDVRASGRMYEEYYKRALKKGIRFIRGGVGEVWDENGKTFLSYEDTLNDVVRKEDFDLVVLAIGMESNPELAQKIGITSGEDGFYEVAHPKLRPAETDVRGVFVAGTASGPRDIQDTISSAGLAASKAMDIILSETVEFYPYNAYVEEDKCTGCRICVDLCNFKAAFMKNGIAEIDPNACTMCGICVSACPVDAIDMGFFSNEQITAQIEALAEEKSMEPIILVFACWYCSYAAADLAGMTKREYKPNARIVRVLCAGRVDAEWILRALELGIDGVMITGCRKGECHFKWGNEKADNRVDTLKKILSELDINPERIKTTWLSAGDARAMAREISSFVDKVEQLNRDEYGS
ncbi:MAG: CoB-CoM heterodisulfide reductase HdrA2 [Archaeoglobaceae archaeon]